MKKKVLLITALTSMVLASVATVLVIGNKEFKNVDATDYTITLDKNSTFDYFEDGGYYYFSIIGRNGSNTEDFENYLDESWTYGGTISTPSDYIFRIDANEGFASVTTVFKVPCLSEGQIISAKISYSFCGSNQEDDFDVYTDTNDITTLYHYVYAYDGGQWLAFKSIVIKYSC